ncbi:MAG: type IV pili twitching motility protein PilT, partial [Nitrospinota bacterium]
MARIDAFLKLMKESGASDLHLTVGAPPILRLRGDLERVKYHELTPELNEKLLFEIMTPEQIEEFQARMDIDFAYEIPGEARFRVNVFRQRKGIGAVFRLIPSRILTVDDLGLPPQVLEFARLKKGLVIVTGPTGSGKSTTLAAIIDYINTTRKEHIITIEDPIEFVHENKLGLVNQREVKAHTQSFAAALRAALREDPDIILVGEMRDLETIELA